MSKLILFILLTSCSLVTIEPDKSIKLLTKVKKRGRICIDVVEPEKVMGNYCIEEIK